MSTGTSTVTFSPRFTSSRSTCSSALDRVLLHGLRDRPARSCPRSSRLSRTFGVLSAIISSWLGQGQVHRRLRRARRARRGPCRRGGPARRALAELVAGLGGDLDSRTCVQALSWVGICLTNWRITPSAAAVLAARPGPECEQRVDHGCAARPTADTASLAEQPPSLPRRVEAAAPGSPGDRAADEPNDCVRSDRPVEQAGHRPVLEHLADGARRSIGAIESTVSLSNDARRAVGSVLVKMTSLTREFFNRSTAGPENTACVAATIDLRGAVLEQRVGRRADRARRCRSCRRPGRRPGP